MKEEASRLESMVEGVRERWRWRERSDMMREAMELRKEADERLSRKRESDFEQMLLPYLQTYDKRVHVVPPRREAIGSNPRHVVTPGTSNAPATLDLYVQQADETTQRQTVLVEELLTEHKCLPPRIAIHTRDTCPSCGEGMRLLSVKSMMICSACNYSLAYMDATTAATSYSDDVSFSSFSYKRINHYVEKLMQSQAKESFRVPDEVMASVSNELKRQRVKKEEIHPKMVRGIIKKLKLRKAYDHIPQVTSRLTGVPAPKLTPEAEERCRQMFWAAQPVFDRHCTQDQRKNFLSYNYFLYKCYELLGYDCLLDSFSLLKGEDKLAKQDVMFKIICEKLDWEFIPSL